MSGLSEQRAEIAQPPWSVDGDQIVSALSDVICEPLGDTPEQATAHAYLIAASPTMREALKRLETILGGDAFSRSDKFTAYQIVRAALLASAPTPTLKTETREKGD